MKIKTQIIIFSLPFILLTGCAHLKAPIIGSSINGPQRPPTVDVSTRQFNYSNKKALNYFRHVYDQALNMDASEMASFKSGTATNIFPAANWTSKQASYTNVVAITNFVPGSSYMANTYGYESDQFERAKLVRNDIIYELRDVIGQNYADYEQALRDDRNTKDLAANLAAIGLTAAATVSGSEATKTILSAIATGVLGASSEIDKELFRSLTIEALCHQMQAARSDQDAIILRNMTNSVSAYPLNVALDDLKKLYQAGFVTRGLQKLAESSAEVATKKQETVEEIRTNIANYFNTAKSNDTGTNK